MMKQQLFEGYLSKIADLTTRSDAREESYYHVLRELVLAIARAQGKAIEVTILPKRTEGGSPDFRVWDGSHQVIGYIEAKAPGTKLDEVEKSAQLRRYKETFPNLILTDFYEFRLYREGTEMKRALLARPLIAQTLRIKPPLEQTNDLIELFQLFSGFILPYSSTAEELARKLALRTRFLREQVILPELQEQITTQKGPLYGFYTAFREYLIAGLKKEQFADLYAQTITYGLFAARTRAFGPFNRQLAYSLIPPTIGILRDIFQYISLGRPSPPMEAIIDDIAAVLNAADMQAILHQYSTQGRGNDPILHFYETFLAEYDPETREQRGVYYTPQPVVRYIVRVVNDLLKTRFGMADGIADSQVTLLDPAAGTLTFIAEAIQLAYQEFTHKYGEGTGENLVRNHILKHFYAFELLMAPYAIGHMKISFLLASLGIPLRDEDRFQFYLTNALEMKAPQQISIPGLDSLSQESHEAAQIKEHKPILVILGNPPYSGISANRNDWTEQLLKTDLDGVQSYYTVDGQPLGEKKVWLQDDYVKFLRFAQWKIHKAGRGIVAMITNHSYLDNPTFRGMRQSLLQTFDEIYILDLHGNSLKREIPPDGSADENVFNIRQGVAISLMIKHGNPQWRGVYHADLYGKREDKYAWLDSHNLSNAGYQPITPQSTFYFFTPLQMQNPQTYHSWPCVTKIFRKYVTGIVTARDNLCIDFDKNALLRKIEPLRDPKMPDDYIRDYLASLLRRLPSKVENYAWRISASRKQLQKVKSPEQCVVQILYRPFDERYIFYDHSIVWRPRPKVMRHMLTGENLAIVITRQVKASETWQHCFISNHITESCIVSNHTSEIGYVCPLYLYPSAETSEMLSQGRHPNLAEWLLPKLSEAYDFQPTPEDVLGYIYAVLYSPTYRQKYAQELRINFPRVPFPAEADKFRQMAALGQRLINLHLLQSTELNSPVARFQGRGDNDTISHVKYNEARHRVWGNSDKYFEGITPSMWKYQIGGYQVLEKYLKDRKGRRMEDPVRYIHIATAIARTLDLQTQIDLLYPSVEREVVPFSQSEKL